MRLPDFHDDGWALESGEGLHREAPDTFWIPERKHREALYPGDYAKLVFRIALASEDDPVSVERMWVVVRERTPWGYFGLLRNEPSAIEENEELWLDTEVPFGAEHIIDIQHADDESVDLARQPPRRPWPRD